MTLLASTLSGGCTMSYHLALTYLPSALSLRLSVTYTRYNVSSCSLLYSRTQYMAATSARRGPQYDPSRAATSAGPAL